MKSLFRTLFALSLLAFMANCAAQKSTKSTDVRTATAALNHQLAMQALDQGKFVLEVDEVFFPDRNITLDAPGCYVAMSDTGLDANFTRTLFPRGRMPYLLKKGEMKEQQAKATLVRKENSKNGDAHYVMTIKAGPQYMGNTLAITLYNNSNRCFVDFYQGDHHGTKELTFRGTVLPGK